MKNNGRGVTNRYTPSLIKCLLVMKLTAFLIFFFSFQSYAENTFAQQKITLKEENTPLKQVFKIIEKQTSYRFVYNDELLPINQKVSINVKSGSLEEVMKLLLRKTALHFKLIGTDLVVITPGNVRAAVDGAKPLLQVSGRVLNSAGEGIAGVSVVEKGTTSGTTTKEGGDFSLDVSGNNAVLVFSYVGFASEEVALAGRSQVTVIMREDTKEMNQVVVVGYGTQRRSDVTGSVSSVPKARLANLPVTNVLQSIQGTVAGVNIVQNSTVPGSNSTSINVRGARSISANNEPYIILDGAPFPGSFNDISPNDIASMEILKDASAVAIYGTRGSNGVILITTKRGTTGKPVISYNAFAGPEVIANRLTPMNGDQYAAKYKAYTEQMNLTPVPVPNSSELPNYEAKREIDWLDVASQRGFIQNHNVSVSGGTNDVKFYVAGDLLKQDGVIKGYQYKRVSVRSNIDARLTSWLNIGTSLMFVNNNSDGGRVNLLWMMAMSPYGNLYNAQGDYEVYPMKPELLFVNPMLGLNSSRVDRRRNFNGTAYAEVQPQFLKGLKYRLNANYGYLPARFNSYRGRNTNDLLGTAIVENMEGTNYTIENILTYNKDVQRHHLDLTALYAAQQSDGFNSSLTATKFINDELGFNNVVAGQSIVATPNSNVLKNGYFQSNLLSQMARLNYSFDSRYLLTVTARRDGSSVFGDATSKYATFPSVAVGWNIGNESFMQGIDIIDNLKIRASYGKSGNQAIQPYQTFSTQSLAPYVYSGTTSIGIIPSNLGNAQLKWETTTSTNLGVDFGLFNNRVNGSIEVYQAKTSDLLLQRQLPRITGFVSIWDNVGETQNRGFELTLNTVNIKGSDFTWESGLNFSANDNKVVSLYGDKTDDIGNRLFIGKPLNAVYDFRMIGVWQQGEDASKHDPGAKPGDLKFADLNGDGKITSLDREYLGSSLPKYIAGLTNTLRYKNFSLTAFLQTFQGSKRPNAMLNRADFGGRTNQPASIGYWTKENKSNDRPALSFWNPRGYGYPVNSSYTRLKDITLTYRVGRSFLDRYNIANLAIYASGRNIRTFTDWIGWDPEQFYDGTADSSNNRDNYPNVASYVLGINLSLR